MNTHRQLQSGQVVLEYFILFVVIALLTIVGLAKVTLPGQVQQSLTGFFNTAAQKVAN